jgi:hypothetical protein
MVNKVKDYVEEMANNYPDIAEALLDCYELFLSEIDDEYASMQHEADLCYSAIDEIIAEYLEG